MAEIKNFPSNNGVKKLKEKKSPGKIIEKKQLSPVIDSKIVKRKKTLGEKFRKTFISDESKDVKTYVLEDVVVPYLKNMFSEVVNGALNMTLFGGDSPNLLNMHKLSTTYRGNGGSGRTNYSTSFNMNNRRGNSGRVISEHKPSAFGLDEIIFTSKRDAEKVANYMLTYLEEYDVFSLAEFLQICNEESEWTHTKYGWSAPLDISIVQVRGGWILDLPMPVSL